MKKGFGIHWKKSCGRANEKGCREIEMKGVRGGSEAGWQYGSGVVLVVKYTV